MSWMCKKKTSVSHSSTKSEIVSHNVGLRMDSIPARDLWDVVMEVSHSSNNVPPIQKIPTPRNKFGGAAGKCPRDNVHNNRFQKEGNEDSDQLSCLDHTTTNVPKNAWDGVANWEMKWLTNCMLCPRSRKLKRSEL